MNPTSRLLRPLLPLFLLLLWPLTGPRALAEDEPPPSVPAPEVGLWNRISPLVEPYVREKHLMGLMIGVIDGDTEQTFGYGRLGADRGGIPRHHTVYEIGSISKVFTGVLLASLALDGSVKLDQPVRELLPEGTQVPKHGEREITLRDLSTHTSGLPRMPSPFEPADRLDPYADYTAEKLYAFLKDHALARAPGEKYAYSNLGAGLLGHALASKTGKTYDELLRERITGPLEMPDTSVELTEAMKARLAPAHDQDLEPNRCWAFDAFAGAGGIRSTLRDMLTFARANLAEADTPVSKALALARKPHFEQDGKGPPIGLGWHGGGEGRVGHSGQTGGYHSFLGLDPKNGRAVIVLCNTASGIPSGIGNNIMKLLAGEKVEPPTVEKTVKVDAKILLTYVGRYALELKPDFILTITRAGDGLAVQATAQPRLRVFAKSETKFAYRAVQAELTFEKDADGKVTGLVLRQHGQDMRAKRLKD